MNLVDSFSELIELKNIDKQTMQHVLEDVFRAMLKKKFDTDEHIDVIVNIDKGDVQIFLNKEIVDDGEVENKNIEIAYSDAIKVEPDFEIGEEVTEEFHFSDFGLFQRFGQTIRNTVVLVDQKSAEGSILALDTATPRVRHSFVPSTRTCDQNTSNRRCRSSRSSLSGENQAQK